MLPEKLKKTIKSYPDFPKSGILFRDVCPILLDPNLFEELITSMSQKSIFSKTDGIVAIDARGFIFGSAIANKLQKPLILARKANKLPGNLLEKEYGLEYGTDKLSIQKDALNSLNNLVIVDDLLATGGTAKCVSSLLKESNKEVLGLVVVIELLFLKGSKNFGFPTFSEIQYD